MKELFIEGIKGALERPLHEVLDKNITFSLFPDGFDPKEIENFLLSLHSDHYAVREWLRTAFKDEYLDFRFTGVPRKGQYLSSLDFRKSQTPPYYKELAWTPQGEVILTMLHLEDGSGFTVREDLGRIRDYVTITGYSQNFWDFYDEYQDKDFLVKEVLPHI